VREVGAKIEKEVEKMEAEAGDMDDAENKELESMVETQQM